MRTEIITVTPTLAKQFLQKNGCNRPIRPHEITKNVNIILKNKWCLTHQGLAFYKDGSLADGQHRLWAIVTTGIAVQMMVTYDLEKSSALAIDVGSKRSIADGIKIGGFSNWIDSRHIAVINTVAGSKRLTSDETLDWLNEMEHSVKFAVTHLSAKRYLANSASQAAVAMAHYNGVDQILLINFCKVFLSGYSENKFDMSIIKLRDEYLSNPSQAIGPRTDKVLKAQRVIFALLNNEILKKLYAPKEYVYPFDKSNVINLKGEFLYESV